MDPIAAQYHRLNHPTTRLIEADVQSVDVSELANIDALWASPPCQGHSAARRKDLPVREDVWVGRDILRYVAELEPCIVMIENVPAYRKHAIYREIVAGLVDLGYTVEARVLNCADYGIPQTRERLIIQAQQGGRIGWPRPSAHRVGWYAAISDILPAPTMPLAPWQAKRWDAAYNALGPLFVDGQFACARNPDHQKSTLTLRQRDEPASTITAHTHHVDMVFPVLLDGQFKYGDDVLNIITSDQPSPCIMASVHSPKDIVYPVLVDNQLFDEGLCIMLPSDPASTVLATNKSPKNIIYPAATPMRARLTTHCAARLQTLPDTAIWPETFSKAIKLIGNAVPSLLAQKLAEAAVNPVVWNMSLWQRQEASA